MTGMSSQAVQGRYVVPLARDARGDAGLLGGKGAGLAELARLGLSVPPGFVITTEACREFFAAGTVPEGLAAEVEEGLAHIEAALGRRFGDPDAPLLVSVRSGAPVSMPGMMDTVLNVGACEAVLGGLARQLGDPETARDCHCRLVSSFKETVGLDEDAPFPQDPRRQLMESIEAVFASWNSPRAQRYRRFRRLEDTGTAVVVQAMVFGNLPERSGTGVVFTRDPSTGEQRLFGDYLPRAQGEDIVAGTHNAQDIAAMAGLVPEAAVELAAAADAIERHFGDMCEIELTVESGQLWILQTRTGQRSGRASIRIAVEMARAGTIDRAEALRRVDPQAVERELLPRLDRESVDAATHVATGIGASPGIVTGTVALDSRTAVAHEGPGAAILVRPETRPEDIDGIIAAEGLITTKGGKTSHAAVVARGLGRCCVVGVETLEVDLDERILRLADGRTVREGETISVDGEEGWILLGQPAIVQARPPSELSELLAWADEVRELRVGAVVSSAEEAAEARERGADDVLEVTDEGTEAPRFPEEIAREHFEAAVAAGERTVFVSIARLEAARLLAAQLAL